MNSNDKTTLYYFTGTGNSLMAARNIARSIGECRLIPIASLREDRDICCSTENMGLVFPLYFEGLPSIVLDFTEKIRLEKVKYVFTVITRGTPVGSGGIFQLKNILKKKSSKLDSGFYLDMPWNYIIALPPPSEKRQMKIKEKAENKLSKIAGAIKNRKKTFDVDPMFFMNPVNKLFIKTVNMTDKKFNATANCNSCGLCKKICPVGNINLINGKPVWNHGCEQCLGCMNVCPQNAINFGKMKTVNKNYINPELKKEYSIN